MGCAQDWRQPDASASMPLRKSVGLGVIHMTPDTGLCVLLNNRGNPLGSDFMGWTNDRLQTPTRKSLSELTIPALDPGTHIELSLPCNPGT
jgi:hypothetical protein